MLAVSSYFWAVLASGIAMGAVFALAALGFLLTYKATGVVNFAQGDMISAGAYIAYWLILDFDTPTVLAYVLAVAIMFLLGVVLERLTFAPLRGKSVHVVVIATLGAAIVMRTIMALWQDPQTPQLTLDSPVKGKIWRVAGANIRYQQILIVIITLIVVAVMVWLFNHTSFGRQVRAIASDRETAQMHGVPVARLSMVAFGLSAALAGIGGVLIGPLASFDTTLGFEVMLGGFAAAILGGFGSLGGVVIGGFMIGFAEQVVGGYWFKDYKGAYPFVLMIIVIALKPQGLFTRGSAHGRL